MKKILKYQQAVLKALSRKAAGFYLAGGTALSLFYFQHRLSVDLDFFTRDFEFSAVKALVKHLEDVLGKEISLVGQTQDEKSSKMAVYNILFTKADILKIDFVEDTVELLKKPKDIDGIDVLSLEDIYVRKIYALAGMIKITDEAGRDKFIGGRADAKDFYDIYFLSHTFMPLSKFAAKYCGQTMKESLVKWFRTYDRMSMMDELLRLDTDKAIDCKLMERHFKREIDRMLASELEGL